MARAVQPVTTAPDDLTGRTVGGYRVERAVGQGGGGARVYLARQPSLNRPVALKVLAAAGQRPETLARFDREARAAGKVLDAGVARVYDFGDDGGLRYLAQEYVAGESLADRLEREGRRPLAEALEIGLALAGGLAAIHRADLVHRDLKPGNVVLAADGPPKIVDFGLVGLRDASAALTRPGSLIGTPLYMAPEQIEIAADGVGPAADVYALGATLHHALTGRVPHDTGDRDLKAFLRRRAAEPVEPPPGLPPEVDGLLRCLLAADPDDRPTAAEAREAFLHALQSVRSAVAPTVASPALAGRRRVPVPVVAAASTALALLLGLVGPLAGGDDDAATAPSPEPTRARAPSASEGRTPSPSPEPTRTRAPSVSEGSAASPGPEPTRTRAPGVSEGSAASPGPGPAPSATPPPSPSPDPPAPSPDPEDPAPTPLDDVAFGEALDRALDALAERRLEEFFVLVEAPGVPPEEREAALALAAIVERLADPAPIEEEPRDLTSGVPWQQAPATSALVEAWEPELHFYAFGRIAAERRNPIGLLFWLAAYEKGLEKLGVEPTEPTFLPPERRGEVALLAGFARAIRAAGGPDRRPAEGVRRLEALDFPDTALGAHVRRWAGQLRSAWARRARRQRR